MFRDGSGGRLHRPPVLVQGAHAVLVSAHVKVCVRDVGARVYDALRGVLYEVEQLSHRLDDG